MHFNVNSCTTISRGEKSQKAAFQAAYTSLVTSSSKFMNGFRPRVSPDTNPSFPLQDPTAGLSSGTQWNVFHGLNSIPWELLNHIPKPLQINISVKHDRQVTSERPRTAFQNYITLTPRKDSFHRSSFRSLVASLKAFIKVICTTPACK